MLITQDNMYENLDSEFWISCLVVRESWCRPGHTCGARLSQPLQFFQEIQQILDQRRAPSWSIDLFWIQLLFKYNKACLEKLYCLSHWRSYGPSIQISLTTLFPQWIFVLPKVVRLCCWANPYSLLQDPFASSVSRFSFQVVIRTTSILLDTGAYQSSWVWICVSHICENRLHIGFSSASTLFFMERKLQYVGNKKMGSSSALSAKSRHCLSSWISRISLCDTFQNIVYRFTTLQTVIF